jgi:hypothetical protein
VLQAQMQDVAEDAADAAASAAGDALVSLGSAAADGASAAAMGLGQAVVDVSVAAAPVVLDGLKAAAPVVRSLRICTHARSFDRSLHILSFASRVFPPRPPRARSLAGG